MLRLNYLLDTIIALERFVIFLILDVIDVVCVHGVCIFELSFE